MEAPRRGVGAAVASGEARRETPRERTEAAASAPVREECMRFSQSPLRFMELCKNTLSSSSFSLLVSFPRAVGTMLPYLKKWVHTTDVTAW